MRLESNLTPETGDPSNARTTSIARKILIIFRGNDMTAPIFWGAAALAILTIMPMERWTDFQFGYLIVSEIFALSAATIRVAHVSWVPPWSNGVGITIASLGVGGLIWVTKNYSMNLSVLFIWVALFAALNFSIKSFVYLIAFIGIEYGFLLIAIHDSAPVERWLQIMGTSLVAGGTVALLIDELRDNSLQDPLTKLANRRAWTAKLEEDRKQAIRSGLPLSVAMIDLDDMKQINDEQGHAAGDRVLRVLGSKWPKLLRSGTQLARIGGDEFSIIAPETTQSELQTTITRLSESTPEITFSVGIACFDGTESAESLIARADKLMYKMKFDKTAE